MTSKQQTAQDAYAELMMQAFALVDKITERIHDEPAPSGRTNWANVGDAREILRRLQEVADFMAIDSE